MRQRVLVLLDIETEMPESLDRAEAKWITAHKTEFDVIQALKALGHEVRILGGVTDLLVLKDVLTEWKPHVVFNLLEQFFGETWASSAARCLWLLASSCHLPGCCWLCWLCL